MDALKATMQQAINGMGLQSQRSGVSAENISDADTPGYKRKLLVPEAGEIPEGLFRQAQVILDQTEGELVYNPSHPMADEKGYLTNSNVSTIIEMADMREANRGYEANLNSFQQARTMYRSLLDVLRR